MIKFKYITNKIQTGEKEMKKREVSLLFNGFGTIIESLILAFNPKLSINTNYYKNDSEALKQDWTMVGKSIGSGLDEYKTSQTYTSSKN